MSAPGGPVGKVISLYESLFPQEPVPTEFQAARTAAHWEGTLPGVYLALPWSALINEGRLSELANVRVRADLTVCQHVRYREILPWLRRFRIRTLLTPHAGPPSARGIRVVPFPHFPVHTTEPAPCKDLLYSFVGSLSDRYRGLSLRSRLFALAHPPDARVIRRESWHWEGGNQETFRREYVDLLARSRFSLCPRGFGQNTLRLWESLGAGAIPIVLADGLRLPAGVDWERCLIRVPEADLARVPALLRQVPRETESRLRAYGLEVFRTHLRYGFAAHWLLSAPLAARPRRPRLRLPFFRPGLSPNPT